MRPNRRALLFAAAAAALSGVPAIAQEASPAPPSGGLVRIDPCTGRPVTARADSIRLAALARSSAPAARPGASPVADGSSPAGSVAPVAGTVGVGATPSPSPAANPGMAPSASPGAGNASGTAEGGTPGAPSAASPGADPPHSGTASSIVAPENQPTPGAASSTLSPGADPTTPGAASSITRDNPPGSAFSPTGAALPDTGDVADPVAAARNREALRLGSGALRGQVRLGPAASVSVPTAFGVDAGELFVGVAYQGRTRFTEDDDAAAVAGLGIGTRRIVAVELALTSYSTLRGAPLETGGLSVKLHRGIGDNTSVAVGWENALLWGGSDDRGSLYGVATRLVPLRNPAQRFSVAVFTLGVGNGRFRFEDDYADDRETVNVFAAAGVRVSDPLSLVADWTGQDLNLAASITPVRRVPLVVTAGVADVTGMAGDGARFILSLGYGLSIRQPF